eukprot:m.337917 g.337917  ORF g.337917 m.337917 type:complete len:228 (-) comp19809_c0_seq3:94-777(-)
MAAAEGDETEPDVVVEGLDMPGTGYTLGFTTTWSLESLGENVAIAQEGAVAWLDGECCYPSVRTVDPLPSTGVYYFEIAWNEWRWYGQAVGLVGEEATVFVGSGSEGEDDLGNGPAWFVKYPRSVGRVPARGARTESVGQLDAPKMDRQSDNATIGLLVDMDERTLRFYHDPRAEDPQPDAIVIHDLPDVVYPAITLAYSRNNRCRLVFRDPPGMEALPTKSATKIS